MPTAEKTLGIIRDLILPVDIRTRYDLHFTSCRIGIVCLGRSSRFESHQDISVVTSAFGVPPPIQAGGKKPELRSVDEEIKGWKLDDLLRLSKKSCYYTYDEIKRLKLVAGHKPKFVILSEECESKFVPTDEQFKQLIELLPKIGALKNKLFIAGSWGVLQEIFRNNSLVDKP
ncbi:MAG: hypothetical protein ACQCN6_05390 [Candidatus Bathyarchaeia archaeon]|jgi:hypothetical protein